MSVAYSRLSLVGSSFLLYIFVLFPAHQSKTLPRPDTPMCNSDDNAKKEQRRTDFSTKQNCKDHRDEGEYIQSDADAFMFWTIRVDYHL